MLHTAVLQNIAESMYAATATHQGRVGKLRRTRGWFWLSRGKATWCVYRSNCVDMAAKLLPFAYLLQSALQSQDSGLSEPV